ncbi:MAG: type II toxin-antitoxin system RelE/ParE family toxin [Rhodanobacteraceae bacterium]
MAEWAVHWSSEARGDLEGIVEFIAARGDVENALAVFERIAACVDSLATMPERGRSVPEVRLAIEPPLMELIEAPWRIMYACERRRVVIAAIIDSRRDVGAVLESRFGFSLPDTR